MSFNRNILGENSKEDILRLVKSNEFKEIFKRNNIENVIIFGSLTKDDFNEESDIDIAIIGENKISDTVDLNLTLELEDFLGRSIDLIDINDEEKVATVVVPDDTLSYAIGAGGQNVRLAAILTGWKIDIKTETQVRENVVE